MSNLNKIQIKLKQIEMTALFNTQICLIAYKYITQQRETSACSSLAEYIIVLHLCQ